MGITSIAPSPAFRPLRVRCRRAGGGKGNAAAGQQRSRDGRGNHQFFLHGDIFFAFSVVRKWKRPLGSLRRGYRRRRQARNSGTKHGLSGVVQVKRPKGGLMNFVLTPYLTTCRDCRRGPTT